MNDSTIGINAEGGAINANNNLMLNVVTAAIMHDSAVGINIKEQGSVNDSVMLNVVTGSVMSGTTVGVKVGG